MSLLSEKKSLLTRVAVIVWVAALPPVVSVIVLDEEVNITWGRSSLIPFTVIVYALETVKSPSETSIVKESVSEEPVKSVEEALK